MPVPRRLPDRLTPVTHLEMGSALIRAWYTFFGSTPRKESVALLLAQWGLETGHGKAMHNFNVGNVKSRVGDGYSWQFFACNEIFSEAQALAYVKAAKRRTEDLTAPGVIHPTRQMDAVITSSYTDKTGRKVAVVWFYPDNPACRFRAFETLDEGTLDHLQILSKRFASAWPFILSGDPVAFVQHLKAQDYFTAAIEPYQKAVVQLYHQFLKLDLPLEAPLPHPPPSVPDAPTPSAEDQARLDAAAILAMIHQSLNTSVNDQLESAFRLRGRAVDELPSDDDLACFYDHEGALVCEQPPSAS